MSFPIPQWIELTDEEDEMLTQAALEYGRKRQRAAPRGRVLAHKTALQTFTSVTPAIVTRGGPTSRRLEAIVATWILYRWW